MAFNLYLLFLFYMLKYVCIGVCISMKVVFGKSKSGKSWIYLGNHGISIKDGNITNSYTNIKKENVYFDGDFVVSNLKEGKVLRLEIGTSYAYNESFTWLKSKRRSMYTTDLDVSRICLFRKGRFLGTLTCYVD